MKVLAFLLGAAAFSLSFSEDESVSPVQRVVKLLGEMKSQLEEEAKKDEEIAQKLECWCKTNKEEKEKAVKDGDARTDELVATIEESAAKKGKLDATIKQAKKELAKLKDALATAEGIRDKERKAFQDEETELVKTVTNLQNAIAVLEKHQEGLLQITPEVQQSLSSVIHAASDKHMEMFGKRPEVEAKNTAFLQTSAENKAEAVFLQATAVSYKPTLSDHSAARLIASLLDTKAGSKGKDAAAPFLGPYAPASGAIFGILTSMLDNFKNTMSENTEAEAEAEKVFAALKKASNEQIAATTAALGQAKTDFAETSKLLSDSKEELEKTRDVRAADVEFLRNLKMQCMDIDKQWELRQKERANEMTAVSEAIAVLTEDDNRELLAKKVTMFTQVATSASSANRNRAAALLQAAAAKSPSWDDLSFKWMGQHKPVEAKAIKPKEDLAMLAAKTKLDAFVRVKKAMDEMTAQIKSQMKEDVAHRDWCTSEFNTNDKDTTTKTNEHEDLVDHIDDLEEQIAALVEEIKVAGENIAETKKQIKIAGEDREKENAVFQTEITEQRATQAVLNKALDKLNKYYAKKDSFLQMSHKQTPPVAFEPYGANAGASPVIALITKIVDDSKSLETEAIDAENQAQANYETFVKDSNNTVKMLEDEIASNTEAKATKKADKVSTETAKSEAETALEMLSNYKADLHASCDFIMKNFEVRQEAMTNEIEAISEAKAILSGAK